MRIQIKPKYGQDAIDRCLDIGTYITENKAAMVLECTPEQLAELKSDAGHYAHPGNYNWEEYRGLILSARASLKMIQEQVN
jgi:hypothetical protein